MLKIICGPSGSGKTTAVLDAIRTDIEHQKRCFLLVPEQQAYISERDLAEHLPGNAGLYFEVANFSGLATDVFRKYGGLTSASANGALRTVLMWETIRTLSPVLKQYATASRSDTALTSLMLSTITELHANGIRSEQLETAAAQLSDDFSLKSKLSDLALIDAVYSEKTESLCCDDAADRLQRMAQTLKRHLFFCDCNVYIDSFTGFTVPEYAVLSELFRQADNVTVTLCADSLLSSLPQFESVAETARRLLKLANRTDTPVQTTILNDSDANKPPELRFLEQKLWDFSYRKTPTDPPPQEQTAVRLVTASNVYEEAEAAAITVCELVRDGMRHGEIAIIVRDLENYRGVLDAALEKYGIPYFLSERTDLLTKPLARLILAALRAVYRNYRQNDILALLKTGLCGVELQDAAMFEEYCEVWHISGSRFTDAVWNMNPDGLTTERSARAERILEAANRVRRLLMDPLTAFAADLKASERLEDRCRAVYDYLCRLNIPAQLSERAREELSHGQRREAGETIRLWRTVTESFSALCRLLPDTHLSVKELIDAMTLLLSGSDIGSVPNVQDCVVIGSADMLRVENIRAALLLGLCEGEFPKAITDDGILTDGDKERLEALDLHIDSRTKIRTSEELLYIYRAVTKPKEKLILSTVAQQPDGSMRTPSLAFTRVRFLLEAEPKRFDSAELKTRLRAEPPPSSSPQLQLPPFPSPTVLRLSQSKIQSFVLCPYRYYSTYTLRLRGQKDSAPSYADDGIFLHEVFERVLRALVTEDGQFSLPSQERVEALAEEIMTDYIVRLCPFPLEQTDRRLLHLFTRLRKLALITLNDILSELRSGQFVPSRFEQVIGGMGENTLPPVGFPLSDGSSVLLSGKIDRVDLYQDRDDRYFRVVDYKSGKHTFSAEEVRSGMDVQLVLYLYAYHSADPTAQPFGAQYLYADTARGGAVIERSGFCLDDPALRTAADSTEGSIYLKKLLPQSAASIEALCTEMKNAVCSVAGRILSGEAQKTPSEQACQFCPVRTHCDKAHRR